MPEKLKYKKLGDVKLKNGFSQTKLKIYKGEKNTMSLKEIKDYAKEWSKKGLPFYIRGRNEYGTTTVRSYDGRYYDENQDYYDDQGYDEQVYNEFYYIELVVDNE
jgi:hypothetical protein